MRMIEPSTNDASIVVGFALEHIEDHYDRLEFLRAWQDGSSEVEPCWSDWRAYRDRKERE